MSTIRYAKTYTSIHASNKKRSNIHWPRVILALAVLIAVLAISQTCAAIRDRSIAPVIEKVVEHDTQNDYLINEVN